jgi:hypothetical protein
VMLAGFLLRTPFILLEQLFPDGSFFARSNLLSGLPLFLFCLIAGLGIQKVVDVRFTDRRTGRSFIDRPTMERISNSAQDILIVSAISRLGRNGLPPGVHGLGHFFSVVFARGIPFVFTCIAGVAWGVFSFWHLAPLLLPDYWAERALVEFGVSIGATSTGLLLLRMADPDNRTPVLTDFTCKQIFHVLITGGGFFDVLVPIPLCATTNSVWPLLVTCLVIMGLLGVAHPKFPHCLRGGVPQGAGGGGRHAVQPRPPGRNGDPSDWECPSTLAATAGNEGGGGAPAVSSSPQIEPSTPEASSSSYGASRRAERGTKEVLGIAMDAL